MKDKTLITLACVSVLFIIGLIILSNLPTVGGSFGYGMPRPAKSDNDDRVVVTNAPPQIVYRIDDHRFLTLENYIACDKSGQIYYHDTLLGIKTRIDTVNRDHRKDDGTVLKNYYVGDEQIQLKDIENGIMAYKGMLLHDATNGALAFPYVNNTWRGCDNNRGCYQGAMVSIDKGKTFYDRTYEKSSNYPHDGTVFTVGNNAFFRGDEYDYGVKIIPFIYGKGFTHNVTENRRVKFDKETLKDRKYDIRLHCDSAIKPTKIRFVKFKKVPEDE
ncbi:hypothetical protein RJ492_002721 [Pluralibacter gergoviae]|uniref:Tli3-like domain-containing protein n=1 Tax=Pluralibacter gergoviae TaxID=61647 RepID=A0AAI9GNR6_PLUGE|nr:hypothetical protein [Pluralibacter gergoviae]EKV0915411.1 hypothetical protein [Pluralibacter gergoviae]EKV9908480.1 hypothetical protein [Pluralibacter gergoviae]EKW7273528.1 hypothetical protein [Pluralibacter gergoviae]ELD4294919.1 hypothetical protein [Pluralibacter gergoviae]ELD4307706.1 hypothetical protein [Pluralibacter gergoviae]